ncbi:S-adenosyl-L-methionine-dependent methyltransferase [Exidia glandulosa HHB12029]|uniref:type I protein arginine methyltransferase n=1 Tax=Exidia glandulosa HHB12029 TaxID=1314781 RepID=A0A166AZD5_EXIGL|nr:S-adenosyl-L-methionine-dependent methyltransferase [Exidia glandulosa HHB12029]
MLKLSGGDLPADEDPYSSENSSGSESDDDQDWADWQSDGGEGAGCTSLFDSEELPSATDCVAYDSKKHGFDLVQTSERLGLDFHQRARLVNYIRKQRPQPAELQNLSGTEPFFSDDLFLVPVIQSDPLLQLPSDDWSDDEDDAGVPGSSQDMRVAQRQIKHLQEKLQRAKQDLVDYKKLVQAKMDFTRVFADEDDDDAPGPSKPRDDDTHYFESYAENDIHAVMINDKVRTSTYASFIMRNPALFRDAVVLDVGCGTGILSLFAAKAGARKVIAVDASDIVHRARQIVKDNDLEDVVTVVHGKIENITLPEGIEHVDIIISEWMGYALIYESMLDSVLIARDRFLKPSGVLAPSHSRMMLALCDGTDIHKERVAFWEDVYGFDMRCMATSVPDDSIIDVVGPNSLVSEPTSVRELPLHTYKISDAFATPFKLVATRPCTKVRALVLYFDVFFATDREPTPRDAEVQIVSPDEPQVAEVWSIPAGRSEVKSPSLQRRKSSVDPRGRPTSFSTGPQSVPTHWKQTVFLLREPINVQPGTVIQGKFFCRKSETNSRELDVEIHYSSYHVDEEDASATEAAQKASQTIVQLFKIR